MSPAQKYINSLYEQNIEFFNGKPRGSLYEVITKLVGANKYNKFSYHQSANMVEYYIQHYSVLPRPTALWTIKLYLSNTRC
jgi:hypothetical protein